MLTNRHATAISKNKLMIIASILLLLLGNFVINQPTSESIYKTTFTDGTQERIIEFPADGGFDESINISIIHGTSIKSAILNLTSLPTDDGQYPYGVTLDVGRDGDIEWAFSGDGYGAMGNQTIFYDSTSSVEKDIQGPSDPLSTFIKMPKSAVINNARLNISGTLYESVKKTSISSSLSSTYSSKVADIDGDNDLDVIVTYFLSSSNYPLEWFENTQGDGSAWSSHSIGTGLVMP